MTPAGSDLLDAALPLFAEHGHDTPAVDALAREAGMTKRELFQAVLVREEERLIDQIASVLPSVIEPASLEHTLVAGFTAYFALAAATPYSWRLVFTAELSGDAEVSGRVERARRVARAGISDLVEELLAAEGVADSTARRAELEAHVLVATAEAAVQLMLAHPDVWTPETLGRLVGRGAAAAHAAYGGAR